VDVTSCNRATGEFEWLLTAEDLCSLVEFAFDLLCEWQPQSALDAFNRTARLLGVPVTVETVPGGGGMATFAYRLECLIALNKGTAPAWAQCSGDWDLAALRQTADHVYERDGEPVRVVDEQTGEVVYQIAPTTPARARPGGGGG
jgi:hypothetical protein